MEPPRLVASSSMVAAKLSVASEGVARKACAALEIHDGDDQPHADGDGEGGEEFAEGGDDAEALAELEDALGGGVGEGFGDGLEEPGGEAGDALPAKRRESAKTARKSVAARERMPARAKASWCGMLRGAKARVVEKMMAAEARSKARSME